MNSTWLFKFTSYSYCQGTRDADYNDMRLINFTLPCPIYEAISHLGDLLLQEGVEYDPTSIQSLTYKITNS